MTLSPSTSKSAVIVLNVPTLAVTKLWSVGESLCSKQVFISPQSDVAITNSTGRFLHKQTNKSESSNSAIKRLKHPRSLTYRLRLTDPRWRRRRFRLCDDSEFLSAERHFNITYIYFNIYCFSSLSPPLKINFGCVHTPQSFPLRQSHFNLSRVL